MAGVLTGDMVVMDGSAVAGAVAGAGAGAGADAVVRRFASMRMLASLRTASYAAIMVRVAISIGVSLINDTVMLMFCHLIAAWRRAACRKAKAVRVPSFLRAAIQVAVNSGANV
jgi:hypothetical protein